MSNSISERSVPMRWPSAWTSASSLELIAHTPVNCLLEAPAAIATAARERGIAAVSRDEAASVVQFLPDPLWPGVRASRKTDEAGAGPTGTPWVNANGWNIRLTQGLNPAKPVWVEAAPEKGALPVAGSYQLAVAEAAVFGARWVLTLDDAFAGGLAAGNNEMKARWQQTIGAVRFFETRRQSQLPRWRANLAVVSDFGGANEFLGKEFLNLADRRNLIYSIVPKRSAARGFQDRPLAILYIDEQPPGPEVAGTLKQVTRLGALLIGSHGSGIAAWGDAPQPSPAPGYTGASCGRGKIAVPEKAWEDPYVLASEVRILVGRRSDVLRVFNAGSMAALYARSSEGNAGVVHLLNYALRPAAHPVSVAPVDGYQRAQWVALDRAPSALRVDIRPNAFNEIAVPPFAVYSAVELMSGKEG